MLLRLTWAAFACRLLVPAGYMPAAWGEGGPIILCPMGLPAGVFTGHSSHHGSGHDPAAELHWEYCPFGALADTAPALPEADSSFPDLRHSRPRGLEPQTCASFTSLGFRSRAPPLFLSWP